MLKNTLLVMGVAAFSVLWWIGLQKVMEKTKIEPIYGLEAPGLVGK